MSEAFLCSIVVVNQIFHLVIDALVANGFKVPTEIVLQANAVQDEGQFKVTGDSFAIS